METLAAVRSTSKPRRCGLLNLSQERAALAKDIPTFLEQGFDLVIYSGEGFFVPKGRLPRCNQSP